VDAALMVRQGAEARDGRPVLGLSRTDPESVVRLLAWVEGRLVAFQGGTLVPQDPGPMAAHGHDHEHPHAHGAGAHP
jgi:urease accessory protein